MIHRDNGMLIHDLIRTTNSNRARFYRQESNGIAFYLAMNRAARRLIRSSNFMKLAQEHELEVDYRFNAVA